MNPKQFLTLMEMAYWELPNSELDPRLVGFLFAISEYYMAAYTNGGEFDEQNDFERGYRIWQDLNHDVGVSAVHSTFNEYHENWSPELRSGYEEGMRIVESLRKV